MKYCFWLISVFWGAAALAAAPLRLVSCAGKLNAQYSVRSFDIVERAQKLSQDSVIQKVLHETGAGHDLLEELGTDLFSRIITGDPYTAWTVLGRLSLVANAIRWPARTQPVSIPNLSSVLMHRFEPDAWPVLLHELTQSLEQVVADHFLNWREMQIDIAEGRATHLHIRYADPTALPSELWVQNSTVDRANDAEGARARSFARVRGLTFEVEERPGRLRVFAAFKSPEEKFRILNYIHTNISRTRFYMRDPQFQPIVQVVDHEVWMHGLSRNASAQVFTLVLLNRN